MVKPETPRLDAVISPQSEYTQQQYDTWVAQAVAAPPPNPDHADTIAGMREIGGAGVYVAVD